MRVSQTSLVLHDLGSFRSTGQVFCSMSLHWYFSFFFIFDSKSSLTCVNFQVKLRKKKWRIIWNYHRMKQLNFSLSAEVRLGEVRWWSIIFFHLLINCQHHWDCQCLIRDKQREGSLWPENWKSKLTLQMVLRLLQSKLWLTGRNTSMDPDHVLGYSLSLWTTAPTIPFLPLIMLITQQQQSPAPICPKLTSLFFYLPYLS